MPAEKTARVQQRKRNINRKVRSSTRSAERFAQKMLTQENIDNAKSAVQQAVISLDKAAQKGIIHPNNAARHKSHLVQKLNKLSNTD